MQKRERENFQPYAQATQSLSWFQSLISLCVSVSKSQYGAVCVACLYCRLLAYPISFLCVPYKCVGYVCLLSATEHLSIVTLGFLQSLVVNISPLPLSSLWFIYWRLQDCCKRWHMQMGKLLSSFHHPSSFNYTSKTTKTLGMINWWQKPCSLPKQTQLECIIWLMFISEFTFKILISSDKMASNCPACPECSLSKDPKLFIFFIIRHASRAVHKGNPKAFQKPFSISIC